MKICSLPYLLKDHSASVKTPHIYFDTNMKFYFITFTTWIACTSCNQYGLSTKCCLNKNQKVIWGFESSLLAQWVDFPGLWLNTYTNTLFLQTGVLGKGRWIPKLLWKACWTIISDSVLLNCKIQNAFCWTDAIFQQTELMDRSVHRVVSRSDSLKL